MTSNKSGRLNIGGALALVLLVGVLCLVVFARTSREAPPRKRSALTVPPENALATLDARFGRDSSVDRRFADLLDQLDPQYPESRDLIADRIWSTHAMLDKSGIQESALTIMEGMNRARPNRATLTLALAEYVTFRRRGMTHDEAIGLLSLQ